MARAKIDINWEEFEKLCGIQCTLIEIAAWFRCSEDTIERAVKRHYNQSFADVFEQKKGIGKISLRRKLYQKAMEGNPALLIWLSKQWLGYTDKLEQKQEVTATIKDEVYDTQFGPTSEPNKKNS
jgi:hypothetical protein